MIATFRRTVPLAATAWVLACGGGAGSGIPDTGSDAVVTDELEPDSGATDPGADPTGDPGTTDPGSPDAGDTGPGGGERALKAALQATATLATPGWTAWAPGEPLAEAVSVLDSQAFIPAKPSRFVYLDLDPDALLAHPVRYAFVPDDGSEIESYEASLPPDLDPAAVGGMLMLQRPAPFGRPVTGWAAARFAPAVASPGDWGDAPDDLEAYADGVEGGFPTREEHDGARTDGTGALLLGTSLSAEAGPLDPEDPDGVPNLVDRDQDDGLLWAIWLDADGTWWHRAVVTVTVAGDGPAVQYVNLLADLDRDGTWDEPDDRERPVKNLRLEVAPGTRRDVEVEVPLPAGAASGGAFWVRVVLTEDPLPDAWIGGGNLGDGEVEDHFIRPHDEMPGEPPVPPGPAPGLPPAPDGTLCDVPFHRRAVIVAGVDLPTKDSIVIATANRMGKSLQEGGYFVDEVVTGTAAEVTLALQRFFGNTTCLDEALVYVVAHGKADGGGAVAFVDGDGEPAWWSAQALFQVLAGLGACRGGNLLAGECTARDRACRQTILFEACHSSAFAAHVEELGDETAGRNVFFSSAAETPSWSVGGTGVFTTAYAEALAAGASPGEAFDLAAADVQAALDGAQAPQKAMSNPADCPCDCCGDGVVQDAQAHVHGVLQPQPLEDCDPGADPDVCQSPLVCGTTCSCVETNPCGNGEIDDGEPCDPGATPTGCSEGETCTPVCTCVLCEPDCDGRECGPDGCGGTCPPGCEDQEVCIEGTCECVPECDGRECGSDGCGGTCPPGCEGDDVCTEGMCMPPSPFQSVIDLVTGPEWIVFGKVPGLYDDDILQAAGSGGSSVGLFNAATGATIFHDAYLKAYALHLIHHPSGPWTMVGCGAQSCFYKTRDDTVGWAVMTVNIPFLGNITDMQPLTEPDPGRILVVSHDNNTVGFLKTTDAMGAGWEYEAAVLFGSTLPEAVGSVISAWAPDFATRAMLVITAGGDLWWIGDWDSGTPERIATGLGTDLRRIRCVHDHCGITDYRSKQLTLVRWANRGEAPEVVGTREVGRGAIGLDLRKDGDAWLYLTTGYDDGTYSLTRVADDFSVLGSDTKAIPGCDNPGHASFHSDPATRYLVVSCHGSDEARILPY